jgi:XRE family aerobic/anaerobic benzoate catabolism transcriptional regulator
MRTIVHLMSPPEVNPLFARVGAQVRALRAAARLTQRELATRSGVSARYLSQLEAGDANISVGRLDDVARALGSDLPTLFQTAATPTRRHVALLGLRGAGKSTLGPRLARCLGARFVEVDRVIEEAAGLKLGALFELHGEGYYRRLEREALTGLLASVEPLVLATGGSLVSDAQTFYLLRERATTVWLRARAQDHWYRVLLQGDSRPMARNPHAMAELKALLAAREPLYAQADRTIDTSSLTVEAATRQLVAALK